MDLSGQRIKPCSLSCSGVERGKSYLLMRLRSKQTEPKGSEKNYKDFMQCIS